MIYSIYNPSQFVVTVLVARTLWIIKSVYLICPIISSFIQSVSVKIDTCDVEEVCLLQIDALTVTEQTGKKYISKMQR